MDLDAAIEAPAMAFFWPKRITGEPAETNEDPYSDKSEHAPKRKRKESSSSDGSEICKRFGTDLDSSESSSSESSEEEKRPKIEEITTINEDEEDEVYEVNTPNDSHVN